MRIPSRRERRENQDPFVPLYNFKGNPDKGLPVALMMVEHQNLAVRKARQEAKHAKRERGLAMHKAQMAVHAAKGAA